MEQPTIQIMDITSLKAVISDLRKEIIPSRLEKAQQPSPNTIQLGFRNLLGLSWIEASWNPEAPRLVRIPKPERCGEESTLARQLQHGLKGMALNALHQEGFERVVELAFAMRPKEKTKKKLILEIMGRHSNILLLNETNKIITLGKQVREKQSRIRPLGTGDIYTPPPSLKGIQPNILDSFNEWKEKLSLIPVNLKDALQDTFQGISPSIALQLVQDDAYEAKKILKMKTNEISNEDWIKIYQRWQIWLKRIAEEDFSISFDGPTHYRVWGQKEETLRDKEQEKYLLGIYYKEKLSQKEFLKINKKIKNKLSKSRKEEESLLSKQKSLLQEIGNHLILRDRADALLCLRGPTKEQINQAQKLYKQSQKQIRSKSALEERIFYHETRINNINDTEFFIDNIITDYKKFNNNSLKEISALDKEIDLYLSPSKKKKNIQNNRKKGDIKPLEIRSQRGLIIQIGRNHSQNEWISIRNARKGDIWFHAQECPGSHVVLKTSCAIGFDEDIQIAADLAALFSRAKRNKKVSVMMVPIQNLKKVPGASPGTVCHHGGKVLWGEPTRGMLHIQD